MSEVGPNAVIRTLEALTALEGPHGARRVFEAAGLAAYVAHPPAAMVPAGEVAALNTALFATLGADRARTVGWLAGRRTGDYLLANRIPAPLQHVLRRLPAALSARILSVAIARHAWTFAGAGRMATSRGTPLRIVMEGCPLCGDATAAEPRCALYAATFERLFGALVHAETRVRETECRAMGAAHCTFELDWRPRPRLAQRGVVPA